MRSNITFSMHSYPQSNHTHTFPVKLSFHNRRVLYIFRFRYEIGQRESARVRSQIWCSLYFCLHLEFFSHEPYACIRNWIDVPISRSVFIKLDTYNTHLSFSWFREFICIAHYDMVCCCCFCAVSLLNVWSNAHRKTNTHHAIIQKQNTTQQHQQMQHRFKCYVPLHNKCTIRPVYWVSWNGRFKPQQSLLCLLCTTIPVTTRDISTKQEIERAGG